MSGPVAFSFQSFESRVRSKRAPPCLSPLRAGWYMHPAFVAASAWSATCSAIGAGLANAVNGCPHCAPVLHCPPVSCHCGSHDGVGLAGVCAVGFGWQALLVSFGAGVLCAGVGLWRLQLAVQAPSGSSAGERPFAGPPAAAAPGGGSAFPAPPPVPPFAGRAPARAAPAASRPQLVAPLGDTLVVGRSDTAVWRPRG